jgi:hypothetical protein
MTLRQIVRALGGPYRASVAYNTMADEANKKLRADTGLAGDALRAHPLYLDALSRPRLDYWLKVNAPRWAGPYIGRLAELAAQREREDGQAQKADKGSPGDRSRRLHRVDGQSTRSRAAGRERRAQDQATA